MHLFCFVLPLFAVCRLSHGPASRTLDLNPQSVPFGITSRLHFGPRRHDPETAIGHLITFGPSFKLLPTKAPKMGTQQVSETAQNHFNTFATVFLPKLVLSKWWKSSEKRSNSHSQCLMSWALPAAAKPGPHAWDCSAICPEQARSGSGYGADPHCCRPAKAPPPLILGRKRTLTDAPQN